MKGEITVEERRVVDRAQENGNGNSCRNDDANRQQRER